MITNTSNSRENIELVMATAFAKGVVQINPTIPFTWKSGTKNPIYVDNRMYLGMPEVRTLIIHELCAMLKNANIQFDGVLGVSTAGIPWAAYVANEFQVPLFINNDGKTYCYKKDLLPDISGAEVWLRTTDAIASNVPWGIAPGAILAQRMNKPLMYVRPQPKDHGVKKQIEGDLADIKNIGLINVFNQDNYKASINHALKNHGIELTCEKSWQFDGTEGQAKGKVILVIDDLLSTSKSALEEVEILLQSGAEVTNIASLFTYGFPNMYKNLADAGVTLNSLMNYQQFIEYGIQMGSILPGYQAKLEEWRETQPTWGDKYFSQNEPWASNAS